MSSCKQRRALALTAVSLSLVACGYRAVPQADGGQPLHADGEQAKQPNPDHDPRFVGAWLVHEVVPHALYSASIFRLGADGALVQTWDAGFYGGTHGYVRDPKKEITCAFGARWRSLGQDLMVIDGECSDARSREIRLRFATDPSMNHAGTKVRIESVGGEPGWLPPAWGWAFRKCRRPDDTPEECGALS
jgi:hypothetical protein